MGGRRKQLQQQHGSGDQNLSVRIPSFFRCPISLDVMKSPVSLCTGVTYDRSSIQRWLESGNNTCPATMQPLPSTDLVPNLTLHRLISLWAHSSTTPSRGPTTKSPLSLLSQIRSSAGDPLPSLLNLTAFFGNPEIDDFSKNQLINAAEFAETLRPLIQNSTDLKTLEAVIRLLSTILTFSSFSSDCIYAENKQKAISIAPLCCLIRVLKEGSSLESRSNAAIIVDALLSAEESSKDLIVAENKDLIPELISLIGEERLSSGGIDAGLSCLVRLTSVRRTRTYLVKAETVQILSAIVSREAEAVPVSAAEKAMKLLEAISACREGRELICETAGTTIAAILRRMMKVGEGGREAAVVVLWSVCHLFKDRRAQEAVEANGGLTKMLVVMQSSCSPATRQMAGDLLKIFRVNAKCCLAGYDTKTTHIMPF